jgi:guanosine-3',5'-bis(diphosphate) 3'-pyrophosphohydrolase
VLLGSRQQRPSAGARQRGKQPVPAPLANAQRSRLYTIEDTGTTPEELEERFGPEVRSLVLEVTDNKRLSKEERKRLQIEHGSRLSPKAKLIKLGDKIANVHDVTATPPADWSLERRREYLDWTEQAVRGCRGSNAALELRYDAALRVGRALLEGSTGGRR